MVPTSRSGWLNLRPVGTDAAVMTNHQRNDNHRNHCQNTDQRQRINDRNHKPLHTIDKVVPASGKCCPDTGTKPVPSETLRTSRR